MFHESSVIFFWSDTTSGGMTEALYQRSRIKLQFVESKWFGVIFIFENNLHQTWNINKKPGAFTRNTSCHMRRKNNYKSKTTYVIEF